MNPAKKNLPTTPTEGDEPRAGPAPVPIWLIVSFGVLFYAGQLYLNEYAGEFSPQVYEPYASLKELKAANPQFAVDLPELGREVYLSSCLPCHQNTGQGLPGSFPPLANSEWVLAEHPGRIIRIVLDGLQGPIDVKGQPFSTSTTMVPWRPSPGVRGLTDQEIAGVLTYIRQEWGNKAPPVSPQEVTPIREKTSDRGRPWTAPELLAIPETE